MKAERDLEDYQSNLPFTDEETESRSVISHDLSKITWPISDSLEKKTKQTIKKTNKKTQPF